MAAVAVIRTMFRTGEVLIFFQHLYCGSELNRRVKTCPTVQSSGQRRRCTSQEVSIVNMIMSDSDVRNLSSWSLPLRAAIAREMMGAAAWY
jgi:hypothetical protein